MYKKKQIVEVEIIDLGDKNQSFGRLEDGISIFVQGPAAVALQVALEVVRADAARQHARQGAEERPPGALALAHLLGRVRDVVVAVGRVGVVGREQEEGVPRAAPPVARRPGAPAAVHPCCGGWGGENFQGEGVKL